MDVKTWTLSNLVSLSIKEPHLPWPRGRRANDSLSLDSRAEWQKDLKQLETIHPEVETLYFIVLEH